MIIELIYLTDYRRLDWGAVGLGAKLRPGNVASAGSWEDLLLTAGDRAATALGKEVVFRADAAFAKPEIYEAMEERGVKYAIQIPTNDELVRGIEGRLGILAHFRHIEEFESPRQQLQVSVE